MVSLARSTLPKTLPYLLALRDATRWIFDMHFPAQVLPFLKLAEVGTVAIQATELSGLALYPARVLQLFAPLALHGEAVEVASETRRRVVRETDELVEPTASGASCVACQSLVACICCAGLTVWAVATLGHCVAGLVCFCAVAVEILLGCSIAKM